MLITERRLRRIIREELIRIDEQTTTNDALQMARTVAQAGNVAANPASAPYAMAQYGVDKAIEIHKFMQEPGFKSLSSSGQQAKYIASRLAGATADGAKAVALGSVNVLPTAGEALDLAWKSDITDATLTTLGAIADFIPGPGTALSEVIAITQFNRALSFNDYLGCLFSIAAMVPIIGDALGAFGRVVRAGSQHMSSQTLKAVLNALGELGNDQVQGSIVKFTERSTDPKLKGKSNDIARNVIAAKESFMADLRQSISSSGQGTQTAT